MSICSFASTYSTSDLWPRRSPPTWNGTGRENVARQRVRAAALVDGPRVVAGVDELDDRARRLREVPRDGAREEALQVAAEAAARLLRKHAPAGLLRVEVVDDLRVPAGAGEVRDGAA